MGEPTIDCENIKNSRYDILTEALVKFLFFLVYDAVYLCILVPAFRRSLLPPSSE